MANQLKLEIVTPTRKVLATEVPEVTATGINGEFTVLPGHTTYLTVLGEGRLVAPGIEPMTVQGGFAEVAGNHVTILADSVS